MKENKFEKELKQKFKVANIQCYSIVGKSGSSSGVSDLELVYKNKVIKLEVKVKHKLTNNQKLYLSNFEYAFIGRLTKKGIIITDYHTDITYNLNEFIQIIKEE